MASLTVTDLGVLLPHVLDDERWVNHNHRKCAMQLCWYVFRFVEVVQHEPRIALPLRVHLIKGYRIALLLCEMQLFTRRVQGTQTVSIKKETHIKDFAPAAYVVW
jgi:hypothetical protein